MLDGAGGTARPNYETADVDGTLALLGALPTLRQPPLAVLSKTEPFPFPGSAPTVVREKLDPLWDQSQGSMVELLPNTLHLVATGSNNYIHVRQPDLVISVVELAVMRIDG